MDQKGTSAVIDVRVREPEDIPACAQALVEVHKTDGYPVEGVDDPYAWLMPTGLLRAWAGELGGTVVGHVAVTEAQPDDAAATIWAQTDKGCTTDIAVLGRLFVLPQARDHGMGEQLVRAATEWAHRLRLRLVLDVMAKDQAAIRLYERIGWHRIGTTSHDSGHGEVLALCYLSPPPVSLQP